MVKMTLKLTKILEVIEELEEEFAYGGSEDSDGGLMPGTPDFEEAKEKIKEILR